MEITNTSPSKEEFFAGPKRRWKFNMKINLTRNRFWRSELDLTGSR
jgi:hypothetical protein